VAEPLEQHDGGLGGAGEQGVSEAGDEQRDPHAGNGRTSAQKCRPLDAAVRVLREPYWVRRGITVSAEGLPAGAGPATFTCTLSLPLPFISM
jgi:hypothetical protein